MPSCTSPSRWPTAGTPCRPNDQLARRRRLEPHLVLDVRDERAVARAGLAGDRVEPVLRHEEQRQALGAGRRREPGSLRAGQHQVHDVLGQVVLGRGDEALDALEVPGAVGLCDRPRAARADVRPGVGLGEHHRGAPAALDHQLGPPPLLGRAEPVHDRGEPRAGQVEVHRRVGPEDQLGGGPLHGRGDAEPAQLGRQAQPPPLAVPQQAVGPLHRLGQRHRVRGRVEHRRVPVGLGEALGERAGGQPVQLAQQVAQGVGVGVDVRRRPARRCTRKTSKRSNSTSRRSLRKCPIVAATVRTRQ